MGIEAAIAGIATFVGTIGSAVSMGAFAIGSIGAGIIGGAIVGAAIGGLSAAITGGSIGKGILFGAIGGAVTGGLGAWAQGGTMLSGPMTAPGTAMANVSQAAVDYELGVGGAQALKETAIQTTSRGLGAGFKVSEGMGMLGQGAMSLGGKMMEGSAMEDMANKNRDAQTVAAREAAANAEKMAEKTAGLQLALADKNNAAAHGRTVLTTEAQRAGQILQYKASSEQIAEQRRQYDTSNKLAQDQRGRQQGALKGMSASKAGKSYEGPSIQEQIVGQQEEMYA